MRELSRPVDTDDGLREMFDLWSALTADALHRVLVLHQPVRGSADAFEPFVLLRKHHETEPASSPTTALLLLTDRRWRNGSPRLVRRIAASGILDAGQLDLLARTFLAADGAVYRQVPDGWFARHGIVIELERLDDEGQDGDADDASEEGAPTLARREVFPPLRRWAAAHELAREPTTWAALLSRARVLDARNAAAVAAGLLDRIDVLSPDAQGFLLEEATTWPHHTVRRLAFEFIATRDGADAACSLARHDPNSGIRAWAATLSRTPSIDVPEDAAGPTAGVPETDGAEQPRLFLWLGISAE